ncbi:amidohydrolase [Sporosarcina ureilytica]|uniref:N-acyl-L-amino acid amidohydrolase n=1 Tax=Sporosarcina ureilytica TaxID=298596 RepID=A0A1D8JIU7_9BACL|nr:amidohydrolase [Sporosarcina ureilytica]AOV08636.1 N-acyl-L-amino acid amidohydrolase [Sporosarcina ureilytica]
MNGIVSVMVDKISEKLIYWRRHLHQYPELSFEEVETSDFIYSELSSFGGLELSRPTKTSVMARLIGKKPGKTIALRADTDALPIVEENDLSFSSKKHGVMHACGHDAHTAMLLGAAKVLVNMKEEIEGEVRFIFQHAEELFPGGASELVNAGVMENVDQIICAHVRSTLETGKVGVISGPVLASPDSFSISVIGSGGHAAKPHQNIDSVIIAAQVVTNLQQIVSRQIDPIEDVVLSVTQIHGGSADNVTPGVVKISGTVRSFNPQLRTEIPERMEKIIKGVTEAHGASYKFNYSEGYMPVINDPKVTQVVKDVIVDLYGSNALADIQRGMGGEDFSAYLTKAPGCFYYLGAGEIDSQKNFPHHHPQFKINEEVLPIGVNTHVNTVMKLLKN